TGLYYFRARYYDPATGRFLSQDPLSFAIGDSNLYRYVGNSPANEVDPTGLQGSGGGFQPPPRGGIDPSRSGTAMTIAEYNQIRLTFDRENRKLLKIRDENDRKAESLKRALIQLQGETDKLKYRIDGGQYRGQELRRQ